MSKALTPHQEEESLLWMKLSVGTWWDHFSWWSRGCIPATREVKNIFSATLDKPGTSWESLIETRDTGAVLQEALLYCAAQTQQT
jgi:hypothetical protein